MRLVTQHAGPRLIGYINMATAPTAAGGGGRGLRGTSSLRKFAACSICCRIRRISRLLWPVSGTAAKSGGPSHRA
jgi:hypothetical protein